MFLRSVEVYNNTRQTCSCLATQLDDFEDLNHGERSFMKLWNAHLSAHPWAPLPTPPPTPAFFPMGATCHMPSVCQSDFGLPVAIDCWLAVGWHCPQYSCRSRR